MKIFPKIDVDQNPNLLKYRTIIYVLFLAVLIISGAIIILIARSMMQGTIERDVLYSIGIVLCTSAAYRILNDLFVKDIDARRIEASIQKIVHENTIGNRVRVFFDQAEIETFQELLAASSNELICCGTSLINIEQRAHLVEEKLKAMPRFKIEFILMDPSTELFLIEEYIENTNEADFLAHLIKSYGTFLQLKMKYPDNVDVYLYHTTPFFSCLLSDGHSNTAKMNLSYYIHGKYPPYCPGMQLDARNPTENKMIKEYLEGLNALKQLSIKLSISEDTKRYWNHRPTFFDILSYVKNPLLIDELIKAAQLSREDQVLEIGSGTGVLAGLVTSHVKHYIGIDTSPDMLAIANSKRTGRAVFVCEDIRDLTFEDERFDKILARMVLHHIPLGLMEALSESFRVLKRGGKLIICENVPNHSEVVDFYKECFQIKEERLYFQTQDLRDLVTNVGFRVIEEPKELIVRTNLDNWLNNNGLEETQIHSIREKFINMPDHLKVHYGFKKINGDVTFDAKFVILSAIKNF